MCDELFASVVGVMVIGRGFVVCERLMFNGLATVLTTMTSCLSVIVINLGTSMVEEISYGN